MFTTEYEFRRRRIYTWILDLITGLLMSGGGFYLAHNVWLQITTHAPIVIGKYGRTIVTLDARPCMYIFSGILTGIGGIGLVAVGSFKVLRQIAVNPWNE
jgi:hypothetical protein